MYVENVVGPDTVNTMPPATLDALLDHGKIVPDTVESDLRWRRRCNAGAAEAKISLFDVTRSTAGRGRQPLLRFVRRAARRDRLQAEAARIRRRRTRPAFAGKIRNRAYDGALDRLAAADFLKRIWAHDATLWSSDPDAAAIIKKSLGWLDIQQHMLEEVARPEVVRRTKAKEQFDFAVVCGMGGSSLAPDILADTFGRQRDYPQLLRARLDLPAADQRARRDRSTFPRRSSSSRARAERRPSRTRSTRTSTKRSPKQLRRVGRGTQLRRDHRSRNDAR